MDKKLGRPFLHSDDMVVMLVAEGVTTVDALLSALGQTHKTTLITRLRRLYKSGRIDLVERTRREGFIIRPKGA